MAAVANAHHFDRFGYKERHKSKKRRSLAEENVACVDNERRLKKLRGFVVNNLDKKIVSSQRWLKMKVGACYLPKENELKPLGEDAHFICSEEQTFGVADGVGGWATKGVDAGEYARELMSNAAMAVHEEPDEEVNPKRVLNKAFLRTKAQGSSTACVLTLRPDNFLHVVNVGDSGFMIFRNTKLVYKLPVQQHDFNRPFQLGNGNNSDRPDMAMELNVRVEEGDVVVVGTDGLLDNMHATEIEEILKRETKDDQEEEEEIRVCADKLALLIAEYALYNSFDRFAFTPFATAAKKAGLNRVGGKIDDITVVVGIITRS